MVNLPTTTQIIDSRHPSFYDNHSEWDKWRLTYKGGDEYRRRYLKRYNQREEQQAFYDRREITPIPSFAKGAINDIRNSIFQRMVDIVRLGGSQSYQNAVSGLDMGVDLRGSTMNSFLGQKVLSDVLIMGMAGIFVDMPQVEGDTLIDTLGKRPYLYAYQREDILNWRRSDSEKPSEFQSLLLRDTILNYDADTFLPTLQTQRYRLMWVDSETGRVNLQFFSKEGTPEVPVQLELERIPFVMVDIGDSLIKDVADHQIALLNLGSSDISYALTANFPFYTEQAAMNAGSHLKVAANEDGTATTGGQAADEAAIKVGATQGRRYPKDMDRPKFISPSAEPLKASMELQDRLEANIRKLVNLAVQTLATRASAESKQLDNQGLEAGLSFIGLVLQSAERQVADFWSAYEDRDRSKRQAALISYPDRYSLKSDTQRIDEASNLTTLMQKIPGKTAKKEMSKLAAATLLGGKVSVDRLQSIYNEIDIASYTTSDPEVILQAKEDGVCSEATAAEALGFNADEADKARKDHTARLLRIAEAQGQSEPNSNPAARGLRDLSGDPARESRDEKASSRQTDMRESTKEPVRGEGK